MANDIEIVDYSEKSIAVFGDTRDLKEELKALGGLFNPRLNHNGQRRAGWIFPLSKRGDVEALCGSEDDNHDGSDMGNDTFADEEAKVEIEEPNREAGDFPGAIKSVLEQMGKSFIYDPKFINALDDYRVFSDNRVLKNILRVLIQDDRIRFFSSKKEWQESKGRSVMLIALDYGWNPALLTYLFDSVSYGLDYIRKKPVMAVEAEESSAGTGTGAAPQTSKKSKKCKHLKFRDIEICGDPKTFVKKLLKIGYEEPYWSDSSVYLKGTFAGVQDCSLWVHFNPTDNIVFGVKVDFPQYQNKKRVAKDYKKLKKALRDLYGKPDESDDYETVFNTSTGIIKLHKWVYQVEIQYYDGYYDNNHGEIKNDIAKLDL